MRADEAKEKNTRVVAFLNRREVDFLDKVGKDALFSTGLKLSRTRLIAWLIDFLRSLNVSGVNITSEEDLEERIREIVRASLSPATEGSDAGSSGNGGKE